MSSSHPGGGVFAASAPSVDAAFNTNGDSNVRLDASCYSGLSINANGTEYEYTPAGATTSIGTWLNSGLNSEVWVEMTLVSGSWNSINGGTGRLQCSTTRQWRNIRSFIGITSTTASFKFWDAASGGNELDSTGNIVFSAEYSSIIGPCPLCCFTPDTPITMASGLQMPIGKVKVGDKIMTLDGPEEVEEVLVREKRAMYRIDFCDGRHINASDDHPLHVKGKGPSAINPIIEYKDLGLPATLKLGDAVVTDGDGVMTRVVRITRINYPGQVYTFSNKKFYANGVLVY